MKAGSGFTLVEILIVVILLGILAAIVVPQFTDASTQTRESSLRSDLQTVRLQVELYKIQHNDDLPGAPANTSFAEAMTGTTDVDGSKTGDDFGPYVMKIPVNPFSSLATVREGGVVAPADTQGWRYDTTSGLFEADDTGHTFADGW